MSYLPPLVAALITILVIALILSSRLRNTIQDTPNERSLHSVPTPRIGGVGLIAGVLAGWAMMYSALTWWLLLPMIGLFIVSLLDDIYSLSVRQRFLAHLVAAAVLVGGSGLLEVQGITLALASVLFVVWMTNLYNFMDGSDGLAGGMALFGFAAYGVAAWLAQDTMLAAASLTIAAAACGFLLFNFHPARIFMGDAGSIPLGFLAAALGIWGWLRGDWTLWFPLLVFSPFIVDATVTLAKRTLRGAKITEAHREHYYQRAIQLGASHRAVALAEYGLMAMAGTGAVWTHTLTWPWQMLLLMAVLYGALMLILDRRWKIQGRVSA